MLGVKNHDSEHSRFQADVAERMGSNMLARSVIPSGQPHIGAAVNDRYDLFVASPMSPFSSQDYQRNRESLIQLVSGLIVSFGFERIFCPAIQVVSAQDFASEYDSVGEDLRALQSSSHFLLHYVNAVKSSAIFEAGIAYERGIKSIYVVREKSELPYLLRELEAYEYRARGRDAKVKIVEVGSRVDALDDFISEDWYGLRD